MRLITKLWATLLLLCVAGVANAAKTYEVDQKFTSIAALDGQAFAIVNEAEGKAVFGSGAQNLGYDSITTAVTGSGNSGYYFKLEASTVEGAYLLRLQTPAGEPYNIWGSPGYLNSGAPGGFDGCFILGLNSQNGQDVENGAVWEIEYAEGLGFTLKNKALGGYFAGPNPAPTAEAPIYWTFCTLKEGEEVPDPEPVVIPEPEAPLAEGELIPDFFSICDEGGIPYGYDVKFNGEDRAYPATFDGGARIFNFGEGGDFTKAIYYREGYVQYGNVKKLALEAGKKYIVYFNTAMWKDSGATLKFTITKEGEETALVDSIINNAPNANGSKDAVIGSTRSEIEFTPEADGNYILKWNAEGWKEVLLANVGVKVAPATPTEDVLPIDIKFGADYNSEEISSYEKTWTATKDGKTWTIANFNNNNNKWNSIKCGRKNVTSVASITSPAINAEVKNYVISVLSVANVNSAKLTIMNGEEKVGEDIDFTETFKPGEVVVPVEGQKGYSYVLTIDNASATANGSVEITKIGLYDAQYEVAHIANTAETAYTVAKAVELIDAAEALTDSVFVKGTISQVDAFKNGAITYWISEDGTTEGQQFECYNGKNINGEAFTAATDIEVGAEVVVKGKITKYNGIYEFTAGNALVSYFKAPIAEGKYYLYNVATQKYLAAGAAWGTHAVVNVDGLDYTITATDGKYTLDSQVSNGGENHFLNGEWNDGAAMGWTFAPVEGAEGVYTISNGEKFLTAQQNGEATLADDATAAAAQWTLKTLADRMTELAAATADAPVNATFLIQDANFGRNDLRKSAWTIEAANKNLSGGNNTNNCAESFHSTFTLSQVLAGAPKGVYAMTAQGFYRQDGAVNDTVPYFFANDEKMTFPVKTGTENSMSDASASFSAGNYTIDPIFVEVTEAGQLTIGAKCDTTTVWAIWDNFVLSYYGAEATIDQVKNAAIIKELAELRAKATELKEQVEVAVVKTDVEDALTATANVEGAEAINAAIATMKTAVEKAEASVMAKGKLATMKQLVDATNVYTEEALNEYYTQWEVKYLDGSITKAEASALQDPFLVTGWHAAITVDNFLLSAWDTNPDFQDAPYYINSWSTEGNNDGSEFKVPFFEYWTGDDNSLGEKTLTATMNSLEAGDYNVSAWVRVRIKNGAEAPTYGITMQANNGEAVNVAAGDQVGTSQMYLKEYTATCVVAEDGVLTIKFNVAADNNISWLSFKNVKFEKKQPVEVAHTWDFTKWSEATVANLKADAAASKVAGWSDVEKKADAEADAAPTEVAKDNCFWYVGGEAEPTANGEAIAELKGLEFNTTYGTSRALAIAVNYQVPDSAKNFGPYNGPAYLWLGGKGQTVMTIKNVKVGTTITMGVESHKITDARGVQLFVGETELVDTLGQAVAAPKTYTEQTWTVPAGKDVVDVIVKNTNGCHIYFIDAEIGESAPVDSALIAAKEALLAIIAADKTIEGEQGAEAFATAITTAETAANAADATIESIAAAREALATAVATFTKANIGKDFAEIAQNQGKDLDNFTRTELVEGESYNTYTAAGDLNIAIKMMNLDVKGCDYVVVKFAEPVAAGWHLAFWSSQDLTDVPAGATEYKYVFADDAKCGVSEEGVLPQICMMTFFGGFQAPLEAKVVGIYKHYTEDYYTTSINAVKAQRENGTIFNLNGQKVNKAQRGLYIINGKKVVVR